MKVFKRIAAVLIIVCLAYGTWYGWQALPIISGYGAKMLCSCSYLAGRSPEDVIANELGNGLLSYGTYSLDLSDSSATGSVFGLANRKAIYRRGLGCTLISEISEDAVRSQVINLPVRAQVVDTLLWPQGDILPDSLPAFDKEAIDRVLDEAFSEPGESRLRRTRAVVIIYKGKIIAERYANGFDANSRMLGWSMTKSLTNAMFGVLQKQGRINVNDPAPIDRWRNDSRQKISIANLMHASSGLQWDENYSGPSAATNMLYKESDMGKYAASFPSESEPETVFEYSSGTSNLLSMIVRQALGDEDYYRFVYNQLFLPIGMNSLVIEPDAGGTFVGSSYAFATARDWGRFGLLFLNNGNWQGKQLLPEDWVSFTTRPAPAAPMGEYGAQFWLNAGEPGNPSNRYYPSVPTDLYWADGYEGQNVFIIPSQDLVVVKLSLSQGDYLDDNAFLAGIINALGQ